jgi:hypothetical protein
MSKVGSNEPPIERRVTRLRTATSHGRLRAHPPEEARSERPATFLHSCSPMRSLQRNSTARRVRFLTIILLAHLGAFCGGRTTPKTTVEDPTRVDVGQLWVEPQDLESRDLFYGSGGSALAPDHSRPYELTAVDDSGYSPGYDVRDQQGTQWSVKLGIEAQPELVASRVLWAVGYHQPPTYVLTEWELVGRQSGTQGIARFRRESADQTVVADWSWYEKPLAATQAFRGLLVANLILNNWDLKTSNNRIYDILDGDGAGRRVYVVRDLGASLGKTTFPKFLRWTPLRGMKQGSRNDVEGFEEQGFISDVQGNRVGFDYHGAHTRLVDALTVEDVVWMCKLMARISDQQWNDAFRAAGYQDAEQQRYITKMKSKIREGLSLAGLVTTG